MSTSAEKLSTISLSDYAARLKARRTVNFFAPEPAPVERLYEAIEVARWAPNHKLTEPWHFHLMGLTTVSKVCKLIADIKSAGRGDAAHAAVLKRVSAIPGWFTVSCANTEDDLRQREDYAACCCAVQNLSLYLWEAGIGTKWTTGGVTRDPRFFEILQIDPDQRSIVGLFWYGFPQVVPVQERKAVADSITELP